MAADAATVGEPTVNCCGQPLNIKVTMLAIGVLEFLALLINALAVGVTYSQLPDPKDSNAYAYAYGTPLAFPNVSLALSLVTLLLGGALICIMVWGVYTERAVLLVPHLVGQAVAEVMLLTLIIFLAIFTGITQYEIREQASAMMLINMILITLAIFGLALEGLFFVRSLACYRYIKNRELLRKKQIGVQRAVRFDNRHMDGILTMSALGSDGKNEEYGTI